MSKRQRTPKPGYLGPAFHAYLEHLERVEYAVATNDASKLSGMVAMNNDLWPTPDDKAFLRFIQDAIPVDVSLARVVRSSCKYRMTGDTCIEIGERYNNELVHIAHTVPMKLPYEWSTIVVDDWGSTGQSLVMVAQEQILDKDRYQELGIRKGDQFGCLNSCLYMPNGTKDMKGHRNRSSRLSYIPCEIHFRTDLPLNGNPMLYAMAGGIERNSGNEEFMELVRMTFVIWLQQFQLQSILREKAPGALPQPGKGFKRTRLRKKTEHPAFEHNVIRLEVDAPESPQTGVQCFQPRKRLHQVRGFWRHYRKSGRRVWVKSHWRGDEALGVVRRDVELVTHKDPE